MVVKLLPRPVLSAPHAVVSFDSKRQYERGLERENDGWKERRRTMEANNVLYWVLGVALTLPLRTMRRFLDYLDMDFLILFSFKFIFKF